MTQSRRSKGLKMIAELYGDIVTEGLKTNAKLAPKLDEYISDFAYGDIYNRNSLTLQQKQIVTISSLITQGCVENELRIHIHGGLNAGLTEEQIIDICVHSLPYIGFPRVTNALETAHKVFEERKKK